MAGAFGGCGVGIGGWGGWGLGPGRAGAGRDGGIEGAAGRTWMTACGSEKPAARAILRKADSYLDT